MNIKLLRRLRSDAVAPVSVGLVLENLERTRSVRRSDGKYYETQTLIRSRLPSLTSFEIEPRNGVTVSRKSAPGPWIDLAHSFLGLHRLQFASASIAFVLGEGWNQRHSENDYHFTFRVGLRREKVYLAMYVGGNSAAESDLEARRSAFDDVLQSIAFNDIIETMFKGPHLYLVNKATDQLELWFPSGGPDGRNPGGFGISGLADLATARSMVERALRCFSDTLPVDWVQFVVSMGAGQYEALKDELQPLGRIWECEFYGKLPRSLQDIAASHDPKSERMRNLPAFGWEEPRRDAFFQADMVLAQEGLRWEITTNCTDLNYAIKRCEQVVGLPFRLVTGDEGS